MIGQLLDLAFRYKKNRKYAAEHDAVDVTDVVGDDNVATALQLTFVTGYGHLDVENHPQQQRKISIQTADDLPAVGQPEDGNPQVNHPHQGEKKHPEGKKRREFKQAHR